MESLSLCLSSSPLLNPHKPTINYKTPLSSLQIPISFPSNFHGNHLSILVNSLTSKTPQKPHLSLPILTGFFYSSPLPSLASEITQQYDEVSDKINLESVLLSIDDFFNKYPFFVSGVTFIWLIVVPLVEEYFKKYKCISAINAFRKLRDESNAQLLDIRDEKSLSYLASPSLRILNKEFVQVPFNEGDEDGFLKGVLQKFADPKSTIVCILDNFDGNSMKVAELLFKNGFKEAYAVKGGLRGKKGWQEIQQDLLPPSVHVYPKKKVKKSRQREMNGAANQPETDQVHAATSEK